MSLITKCLEKGHVLTRLRGYKRKVVNHLAATSTIWCFQPWIFPLFGVKIFEKTTWNHVTCPWARKFCLDHPFHSQDQSPNPCPSHHQATWHVPKMCEWNLAVIWGWSNRADYKKRRNARWFAENPSTITMTLAFFAPKMDGILWPNIPNLSIAKHFQLIHCISMLISPSKTPVPRRWHIVLSHLEPLLVAGWVELFNKPFQKFFSQTVLPK